MRLIGKSDNGFTLVELLVALAILSVSMIAIYRAFATGTLASDRGRESALLALEVQSIMAELGVSIPIVEADLPVPLANNEGWTITAKPIDLFGQSQSSGQWQLYDISIATTTLSGREITFQTRRISR